MSRSYIFLGFFILMIPFINQLNAEVDEQDKAKQTWWQQRHDRGDIYYPHKAHFDVMNKGGDSCILCHSFAKNKVTKLQPLKIITAIANEPLEAICHDCHLVKQNAPTRCDLCHIDNAAIWPEDHDFDYSYNHTEAARKDSGECQTCHIELAFCTDCHFRRDSSRHREHLLGYSNSHGIDARFNAISCSRCHNVRFCSDCHQGRR